MKFKYLHFFLFAILLSTISVLAQSPDLILNLSELIEEALNHNPDLKASFQNWKAAEKRIPQVGALPDPTIKIGLMNLPIDSWTFNQEPMTGKQIGLMQMFPFPGKLGLQKKIAGREASMAEFEFAEARNQVMLQIKLAYYQLFYLDKSIESSEKNAALLQQLTAITEARYRLGKGLQQDVLKSQLASSQITDNLINLQQKRRNMEVQLNFLLNRSADERLGKPAELPFPVIEYDLETLKNIAEDNRPLLQSYRVLKSQSSEKVRLAQKGYWPDFSVEVTYNQRDRLINGMEGIDFLSGMVSMSLPLYFWQKQKKEVQEKRLSESVVEYRYQSREQTVNRDLEQNLSELRSNQRRLQLYNSTIVPQASRVLESALSAYQVDEVDFLTVIENQMTLFKYELEYFRVYSDYLINIANLEFLTGKKLTETP